ncbi:FAD-dependent oxidoreductase [Streptomyces capillispiralis]|uniref:FAD-dependent oxidoreductase n=1 Tax=Streptomyces capillispiralis TaxID=68182 RepID=UPI0036963418
MTRHVDVVVVGGGQAGLAAGYHLRRQGLDFVVLDAQAAPGGAWQHAWDSLRLFSPAAFSSLPGRLMPVRPGEEYPDAGHVVTYLGDYETRYGLPVLRPVRVLGMVVRLERDGVVWADGTRAPADAVVWCTGFRPALSHLSPLGLRGPRGRIATRGTRAVGEPRLHLLGYGDWTGPASATLIGVGRTARDAAREIAGLLGRDSRRRQGSG